MTNYLLGLIIGLLLVAIVEQRRAGTAAAQARDEAAAAQVDAETAADLAREILRRIEQSQTDVAADLTESHERADAAAEDSDTPGAAADAAAVSPPAP